MNEKNFIYFCDPQKNHECKKTDCQKSCFMTTHKEFSKDGRRYYYAEFELREWKEGEMDG